jgi:hypothetical protein
VKLLIELVPSTAWEENLRNKIGADEWDQLRSWCYRKAGYRCEICGGQGPKHPVECHEIWEYNDGVQKLMGLIALCPACHEVKHFGRAQVYRREKRALEHLMKVNKWSKAASLEHVNKAFELWAERSCQKWKLDLSWVETM